MRKNAVGLIALACVAMCSPAYALWSIADKGTWPDNWPKEMEPLRKQSRSLTGGIMNQTYYEISFTDREQFEAVWPKILSLKTKGAPVVLQRGPHNLLTAPIKAGVRIHCAVPTSPTFKNPPIPLQHVDTLSERWLYATYIELIVDGEVVDLNRISLPSVETPILDKRFVDEDEQRSWSE